MKAGSSRSPRVAAVLAGLLLLAGALGLWWLRRTPRDPRDAVRRLWAGRGVEKPNVVLITLDTTRADHLDGVRINGNTALGQEQKTIVLPMLISGRLSSCALSRPQQRSSNFLDAVPQVR